MTRSTFIMMSTARTNKEATQKQLNLSEPGGGGGGSDVRLDECVNPYLPVDAPNYGGRGRTSGPCWEGMWPFLDAWEVVGLRTTTRVWNVAEEYGPFAELFFFLTEKEPTSHAKAVSLERGTEDGMSSSEEEGEHNVENFMLCSFAHHACSPHLQESLIEEELCEVT